LARFKAPRPNGATQTLALITDSSCDLPGDEFIRRHIHVVPVVINFGEQSFVDKVTLTDKEFYKMLRTNPHHPKTSQPAPGDFQEIFKQAAESYQQGLAIILSGGLSGTLQSAQRAAQMMKDQFNVEVIDSRSVTIALALIVREAAAAIERGDTVEEVKRRVQWAVKNTRLFVSVETMEYLVRGGRVSRLRGAIARLLDLKPILTLTPEGKVEAAAKTIGGEHARKKLVELVLAAAKGKKNLRFMVAHADAIETAGYYAAQIRKHFEVLEVPMVSVSPALGAHAGPGAAGIAFLGE
jgi:DegV family protein with EDD domain